MLFKEHSDTIRKKLFKQDDKCLIEDLFTFGDKTRDILGVDTSSVVDYIIEVHEKKRTPGALWFLELPLIVSRWALWRHEKDAQEELEREKEEAEKKAEEESPPKSPPRKPVVKESQDEKLLRKIRFKGRTMLGMKLEKHAEKVEYIF